MPGPIALLSAALERPGAQRFSRPAGRALFGELTARRTLPGPLRPRERHTVSVVMPSYGYADYIQAAIRSAATQEGVDVEVVVVDDCGPDDSLARAHEEAARHPEGRVRVVQNEHNLGHTRTFDHGCRLATGEFLVRLDADDLLTPGSLARAVAVMEAEPDVGLVYGHALIFTTDDAPAAASTPDDGTAGAVVWDGQEWMRRAVTQARNFIATPEAMLRRSVLDRVGPWDVDLPHQEDLEIWLRVAASSDVARIHGAYQAAKRDTPTNMTNTAGNVGVMGYTGHRDAFEHLFPRIAAHTPDADALEQLGRAALARQALAEALAGVVKGTADPERIDRLEAFARDNNADPAHLARLERARALGPRAARDPRLRAAVLAADARETLQWAHYASTGI